MLGLLRDLLFLCWVGLSITAIGVAVAVRFSRLNGLALLGYGLVLGVTLHAGAGILIALNWHFRHWTALVPVAGLAVALIYLLRKRRWSRLRQSEGLSWRTLLIVWGLFLLGCIAITRVEISWPETLPDGPYIFKTHTTNVKVQQLTGLPSDNSIPYLVTEFFARRVSFAKEHPLLPGNEISNRTILMSLVALPFRTVSGERHSKRIELGTFNYVGQKWPDVGKLYDERSFRRFLLIGFFLNSLLLVGVLVFMSNLRPVANSLAVMLLFVTNPFIVTQTVFTWPKALGGFFVLLAWNSMRLGQSEAEPRAWHNRPAFVGLLAALAYHSHPLYLAAAGGLGLWYLARVWRRAAGYWEVLEYAAVLAAFIVPWMMWTRWFLALPADLFTQNFMPVGDTAWQRPLNFLWVRAFNLTATFMPISFFVYPFELGSILGYWVVCLPTAVGLFFIVPALRESAELFRTHRAVMLYGIVIPCVVILVVFSLPSIPTQHGWQPVIAFLIFLGAARMHGNLSTGAFRLLIGLQITLNLTIIALRGLHVGAHF